MMRGKLLKSLCAAAVLLLPAAAQGQTAWDSPLLLPPRPAEGFGLFIVDMHGGGVGLLGTWQSPTWNFGVRGGISEGPAGEDLAVFGGIDYSGPVNTATADFPIDIDWVFGAGLALSDGARISFPLGLTAGHSFQGEGARFTPYVAPRVVLDAFINSERRTGRSSAALDLAVDIGLDLHITQGSGPFHGTTIRFGATVGDRNAVGLGLVF